MSLRLQVVNEIKLFDQDSRPGRLLMIGLSPRVNHPESGTRVVTISDQAISLARDRCKEVISIVTCGGGLFLIFNLLGDLQILEKLEQVVRETGRVISDDGIVRLHVKKVNFSRPIDFLTLFGNDFL